MLSDDDDGGIFEACKKDKKDFCNVPEGYKMIMNEQDVVARNSKRVKYTTSKLYENKGRT